jgi:hypothetical protein
VPDQDWVLNGVITIGGVPVRVTDAARDNPHPDLVGLGAVPLEIDDLERLAQRS